MKSNPNQLNAKPRYAARHLLQLCLLPLFLVAACAGCKQDAKVAGDTRAVAAGATDINPAGTYNLVTVDGKTVPCTIQHEGHSIPIKSGAFIINAEGTCSSKMFLEGRDAALETKATFTREGQKLTMQWQGAGTTIGTVEGDTFTMNNEGMVLAYRK
jgi:hypothetical protein